MASNGRATSRWRQVEVLLFACLLLLLTPSPSLIVHAGEVENATVVSAFLAWEKEGEATALFTLYLGLNVGNVTMGERVYLQDWANFTLSYGDQQVEVISYGEVTYQDFAHNYIMVTSVASHTYDLIHPSDTFTATLEGCCSVANGKSVKAEGSVFFLAHSSPVIRTTKMSVASHTYDLIHPSDTFTATLEGCCSVANGKSVKAEGSVFFLAHSSPVIRTTKRIPVFTADRMRANPHIVQAVIAADAKDSRVVPLSYSMHASSSSSVEGAALSSAGVLSFNTSTVQPGSYPVSFQVMADGARAGGVITIDILNPNVDVEYTWVSPSTLQPIWYNTAASNVTVPLIVPRGITMHIPIAVFDPSCSLSSADFVVVASSQNLRMDYSIELDSDWSDEYDSGDAGGITNRTLDDGASLGCSFENTLLFTTSNFDQSHFRVCVNVNAVKKGEGWKEQRLPPLCYDITIVEKDLFTTTFITTPPHFTIPTENLTLSSLFLPAELSSDLLSKVVLDTAVVGRGGESEEEEGGGGGGVGEEDIVSIPHYRNTLYIEKPVENSLVEVYLNGKTRIYLHAVSTSRANDLTLTIDRDLLPADFRHEPQILNTSLTVDHMATDTYSGNTVVTGWLTWTPSIALGGWKGPLCVIATDAVGDITRFCLFVHVLKCNYAVQNGETLRSISTRFGTDWLTVLAMNPEFLNDNLEEDDVVRVGHVLEVQAGETLQMIEQEYALLPNSLSLLNRDLNGVDSKKEILGRNTFGGGVTHLCTFPMTNPSLPGEECF
eukprot:CAMPEP_0113900218 /NCGR_PEP_ID=MMETSP0780_2-20120614/20537_1 /TAXON_ID=652834 /ORGANISM="Palpitomonas bilix" /LENGTH=775 /DNA_ID=CAMNT_0000892617 /DNA_START=217 /DNA_END=2544 /DNA_ORIENTATION=- /assembly_acc=CAM_ASM_000599